MARAVNYSRNTPPWPSSYPSPNYLSLAPLRPGVGLERQEWLCVSPLFVWFSLVGVPPTLSGPACWWELQNRKNVVTFSLYGGFNLRLYVRVRFCWYPKLHNCNIPQQFVCHSCQSRRTQKQVVWQYQQESPLCPTYSKPSLSSRQAWHPCHACSFLVPLVLPLPWVLDDHHPLLGQASRQLEWLEEGQHGLGL